jgi:5-(carboxyamino)imidazole ribonucleotide synthase
MDQPLEPGATIGILGGGQLGKMLAMAASEMGYNTHIYTNESDCPAAAISRRITVAEYDDEEALASFAKRVDVVTYEFENIPISPVRWLAAWVPVYPDPDLLSITQHRVQEKQAVRQLGITTAPFQAVTNLEELKSAVEEIGLPAILKTCRMGYDGKGQLRLEENTNLELAWKQLDTDDAILEGLVNFELEISVIVARNHQGDVATYCPVHNIHKNHILSETIVPAPISPYIWRNAMDTAQNVANGMDLHGLLAIEMFVTKDDNILINEMAPRPHNSGHWTLDAAATSQFHQTIRAVTGQPLGSTQRLCSARMINLIGDDIKQWPTYMAEPATKVHIYGKKEIREGRKMGHVTQLQLEKKSEKE